jgi:hypothetical protein
MASDNLNNGTDPNEKMNFGYYVVCLIDVLGQKAKLAQWADLPPSPQAPTEFIEALKKTAGTVMGFSQIFHDYFYQVTMPGVPPEGITITQDMKDLHQRYKECKLGKQQFSDTFVFYSPLCNTAGDVSIVGLYYILSACSMAMLASLATHNPLRGSICIGTGTELAEGNFYGPALAEAHYLESNCADYPRIVVSDKATRFTQGVNFSKDVNIEQRMRDLAALCRSLLCHDIDKKVVVDYLGEGMRSLPSATNPSVIKMIQQAYSFVTFESDRFRQAGDEKHVKRYECLRNYFESRLPIWGIKQV